MGALPAGLVTDDQLKVAVVKALELRRGKECRVSRLPVLVCQDLGIRLYLDEKRMFRQRVVRIVEDLTKEKVVEPCNRPRPWVRLAADHEIRLRVARASTGSLRAGNVAVPSTGGSAGAAAQTNIGSLGTVATPQAGLSERLEATFATAMPRVPSGPPDEEVHMGEELPAEHLNRKGHLTTPPDLPADAVTSDPSPPEQPQASQVGQEQVSEARLEARRRRALGMSSAELKRTIVKTLGTRRGRPCALQAITDEVLLHLGVSLNPADQALFEERLKRALSILRVAEIVGTGGAGETGLRLTPNYRALFRQMEARAADAGRHFEPKLAAPEEALRGLGLRATHDSTGSESAAPASHADDDEVPQEVLDPTAGLLAPPDLPPDAVKEKGSQAEEQQETAQPCEEIDHDPETLEILERLTGETGNRLGGEEPEETSLAPPEKIPSAQAIFSRLSAALEMQPGFVIQSRFKDLVMGVPLPGDDVPLEVTVSYSAQRRLLIVRATLPWVKAASCALLELAGSQEFGSTIGVVLQNEERVYVVRRVIAISAETEQVLHDTVLEVIAEAAQAKGLIRRYL